MWLTKFLKSAVPFYVLFASIALVMLTLPVWMQGASIVKALVLPIRVLFGLQAVILLLMLWRKSFPATPALVAGVAGVAFAIADFLLFHYLALQGYYYLAHNVYFVSILGSITAFLVAALAFKEIQNLFYLRKRQ